MKQHAVLTEAEFNGLRDLALIPLDDLPIGKDEKAELRKSALGRLGPTPAPDDDAPKIDCAVMYPDGPVVCVVYKSGRKPIKMD